MYDVHVQYILKVCTILKKTHNVVLLVMYMMIAVLCLILYTTMYVHVCTQSPVYLAWC